MTNKTATPSNSRTVKFHLPRTSLQKAAVTLNSLANSGYLAHFLNITPDDITFADRIVKDLPPNMSSNKHNLAFSMSTPMSLASSPEVEAYAAAQNEATAGAIQKHVDLVKAARELEGPAPTTKGAGNCTEVWDALEKCWGQKVAEDAWFEYINGDKKGGEGSGGGNSAASGASEDQGKRPWKRAGLEPIGGAVNVNDGRSCPPGEGTRGSAGPGPMSITIEMVYQSGEIKGPGEEPKKLPAPDPAPTYSADSLTATYEKQRTSALEQNLQDGASHEVS
ncbi:hypothetical protein HOY82DRAFT_631691 [Tuber indicum]|nr:hypothetical protein HOY82DRAFT_631691 [Tuber indicum]